LLHEGKYPGSRIAGRLAISWPLNRSLLERGYPLFRVRVTADKNLS